MDFNCYYDFCFCHRMQKPILKLSSTQIKFAKEQTGLVKLVLILVRSVCQNWWLDLMSKMKVIIIIRNMYLLVIICDCYVYTVRYCQRSYVRMCKDRSCFSLRIINKINIKKNEIKNSYKTSCTFIFSDGKMQFLGFFPGLSKKYIIVDILQFSYHC